ncbi:metal-iron-binding protein [Clostridium aestuarii]|uniref:Metal-iron-binding protein n=1 Tax=Clostridium aestuarii TaxID=338193 RepID=A0ABT4D089_9CLOT|nr:ferritin-like domain-containing protein [Clostridium aestuarii]MCY6484653.1 metal-iron-binding protein [Clostridium aestuarii]
MKELKCLVCGMKINENNYSFNSYAFINKNREDYILYCPFCGVNEVYLKEYEDVYSVDVNTLDSKTLKILDHAMKLEVFNGEFYAEASKLVKDENVKREFYDLSKIEYMHAKVHKKLGGFKELPILNKPDYTKYISDEEFLEAASKREEHAVAYYEKYSKEICDDVVIKVFKALSDVEKEHVTLTEN